MTPRALLLPLLALLPLHAGCSSYREVEGVLSVYGAGRFEEAVEELGSKRYDKLRRSERDGVLLLLEEGKMLHDVGRFEESEEVFTEVDRRIRSFDRDAEFRVGGELGGLLTNQEARAYRGREWEKILLECYRALNQLALGDLEEARVFTRRAFVRQEEAVLANEARIEAARDGARAKGLDSDSLMQGDEVRAELEPLRTRVDPAYADYSNPMASWVAAMLAWCDGDASVAEVDLRKASAMVPDNRYLRVQYEELGQGLPAGSEQGRVYVLFENGLAPRFHEEGIGVWTPSHGYSALVLPVIAFHPRRVATLSIADTAGTFDLRTEPLADVDDIVATDFLGRFPGILLRTLLSVVTKEVATHQLAQKDRDLGLVLGSLWKLATARADLRTWRTPGAEFQMAHADRPASGALVVRLIDRNGGAHLTTTLELPDAAVVFVLVRSAGLDSLRCHVIPLSTRGPAARAAAGPAQ